MPPIPLILASASPRRVELLRTLGLTPIVRPQAVDETPRAGEPPDALVRRLARAKAASAMAELARESSAAIVLAADTIVVLDGDVLGKPRDAAEASAMLRRLSGRQHRVLTGIAAVRGIDGRGADDVVVTHVRFRALDEATVSAYVRSGEALDKAGAYGIQGAAAGFVSEVRGSWSNVVGLPLERLPDLMLELGTSLDALR